VSTQPSARNSAIGTAVVGAGNWGKNLARNFHLLDGAHLAYVCDVNEATRSAMGSLYPEATITSSYDAVLASAAVECVVLAIDAPLHYKFARAALNAGKHVYVEKPLTLRSAEALELVELADSVGRKLMVGHLLEYHPAVNFVRDMIRKGEVGDAHYLYFQRLNLGIVRKEENAWWSLAPHDISMACYFFDAKPLSVSASGQSYLQSGIEDVVFATLKFDDGRMAHIHVSWLDPHKMRKVTLVGSQRMVVFDDMEGAEKIRIYDKGAEIGGQDYSAPITLRTGDIVIPRVPGGEPLRVECQHFLDCIRNDQTPRSDGRDGLRVVEVLEAGSESLKQGGKSIELP
jgi:predicted dehydrogenase